MIDKGVDEGVAHCPARQRHPNGVLHKEYHTRTKMGKETGGKYAYTPQNKGEGGFIFPLHFPEKAHEGDACKGKKIIEDKGRRGENIRGFDKVQKPVDKSHNKAVSRAVDVGKKQNGDEGSKRYRTAVLHGLEFDKRKHKRACNANAGESDTLGIVLFIFLFMEKAEKSNEEKQKHNCADGNPLDGIRRFCAHFKKGIEKHKNTPSPSLSKKNPTQKNVGKLLLTTLSP